MKYNLNKKAGIIKYFPGILFFMIVAILFFLFYFGFIFSGAKGKITDPILLDNELHMDTIQFLQTPVSLVDANYKTNFLADEEDTFADIIPKICNSDNGNKEKLVLLFDLFYYVPTTTPCINGKTFGDTVYTYFNKLGADLVEVYLVSGIEYPLKYKKTEAGTFASYNNAKTNYATVILPSGKISESIKFQIIIKKLK